VGSPRALAAEAHSRLADVDPQQWDALSARPPASINASRAWVTAAFETVDRDADPCLIAVRDGERLVGLLPLALGEGARRPVLRFAGAPHNDMTDLLVLHGYGAEATAAALATLGSIAADRDLDLDELDPDGALAAADREGHVLRWSRGEAAPVVDLCSPWETAASPHRRQRWDAELRRLRADHAVELRWLAGSEAVAALPDFVRRREARLEAKGRPLDLPPIPLLEAAVAKLAPAGRCAFVELSVDGAPAASDLYLLDWPIAMAWLRALDARWRRFSCGHLLMRATAEGLRQDGYEALDLGRGDEPYKFLFGAGERRLLRVTGLQAGAAVSRRGRAHR
jgi:CelD/BcsL family acetyltransferase involved in cellulose biosynthesis